MTKRVIFLHPNLGIGGAERAIVDACIALKQSNYEVKIYTNYHDKSHCFKETKDGSIDVLVIGSSIPINIFGYFHALLAYIKMFFLAIYIILFEKNIDLVFIDQVSLPLVLFKVMNIKTIFYCHFPDKLLVTKTNIKRKIYRMIINKLEATSMNYADLIFVNSKFTETICKENFKRLQKTNVLYPVPNTNNLILPDSDYIPNTSEPDSETIISKIISKFKGSLNAETKSFFLSVNRYERKKDLELGIRAFHYLLNERLPPRFNKSEVAFIHMGGYDEMNRENVDYFQELYDLVDKMKLSTNVLLLKSVPQADKLSLLGSCTALIYTPKNEHFGITPVEAMYLYKPVIALNSGGLKETVIHGKVGFLCNLDNKCDVYKSMAQFMERLLEDPKLVNELGKNAHEHVQNQFSFENFKKKLTCFVEETINGEKQSE